MAASAPPSKASSKTSTGGGNAFKPGGRKSSRDVAVASHGPRRSSTSRSHSGGSRRHHARRTFAEWKTELCSCFDDQASFACESCCCGFFCPCFSTFRSASWVVDNEPDFCDCISSCSLCLCSLTPICCPVVTIIICGFACQTRSRIAERYDMDDVSVVPVVFCLPCVLAQHERELDIRGAVESAHDAARERREATNRRQSRRRRPAEYSHDYDSGCGGNSEDFPERSSADSRSGSRSRA
eukprot:c40877_g1_i1.p1 GENE.c40877_g1_i1~~c40877_g1_i1.p1  ORF type:complete len:267 (+),score=19.71 c40877_g1_i1:84-803(+)